MLLVARYSSTKHLRSPLSMRTLLCALHNPRREPVLEIAYPEDNLPPSELDLLARLSSGNDPISTVQSFVLPLSGEPVQFHL